MESQRRFETEQVRGESPPYQVGDTLIVSYDLPRLRPRKAVVLEQSGDVLTLSWGVGNKGFRYFDAVHSQGRLLVGKKVMLIIASEHGAGHLEAKLFQIYRECVAVGLGAVCPAWDGPLPPEQRRAVMQALYVTSELWLETQRIEAIKCLYGAAIGSFSLDFELSGLEKKSLPDGRHYQLDIGV